MMSPSCFRSFPASYNAFYGPIRNKMAAKCLSVSIYRHFLTKREAREQKNFTVLVFERINAKVQEDFQKRRGTYCSYTRDKITLRWITPPNKNTELA